MKIHLTTHTTNDPEQKYCTRVQVHHNFQTLSEQYVYCDMFESRDGTITDQVIEFRDPADVKGFITEVQEFFGDVSVTEDEEIHYLCESCYHDPDCAAYDAEIPETDCGKTVQCVMYLDKNDKV